MATERAFKVVARNLGYSQEQLNVIQSFVEGMTYLNNGIIWREASVCKFRLTMALEMSSPQPKQTTAMVEVNIQKNARSVTRKS